MFLIKQRLGFKKPRLTKRAPDAGDSGAIPSIFLRLSIFPVGRRSAARPSAGNANRWVLRSKAKPRARQRQVLHCFKFYQVGENLF